MSLEIIKACKPIKISPTQKSVLMALAWYASEDGEFWGSVATVVEHTCLSERAVRKTLHDLVSMGLLRSEIRNGTSNKYTVTPCTWCTPAPAAPLHVVQPPHAPAAPPPLHVVHPTPARGAPNKQTTTTSKTFNNNTNAGEAAERFGRFWSAYPKKTGKGGAEKAFAKLNPDDPLLDAMLATLAWQVRQPGWIKDGGQFVPNPQTWLNQRRWEDERPSGGQQPRHSGFAERDYSEGVLADGRF